MEKPSLKDFGVCFICGPKNPYGLRVSFRLEDGISKAEFWPEPKHQGWADYLHGGLVLALLDEALAYAAYHRGFYAVTAKVEARLRKPIRTGQKLAITGKIISQRRKIIESRAAIHLEDGSLAAEAKGLLYIFQSDGSQ